MKKATLLLICLLFGALLCFGAAASEEPTVYVSSTGNDTSAGTPDAPLQTIYAGFRALPNGGKMVLMTEMELSQTTNEFPKADGLVTITSHDGTTDYRKNGASVVMGGSIALKSPVKFEDLAFTITAKNLVFLCNGYYTCFGEGLTMTLQGTDVTYPSIVGGTQGRLPANGSFVEVHSGTWLRARTGARGTGAAQLGDATFVIHGGTFTSSVDLGGDSDVMGNADLYIFGGTFLSSCNLASNMSINGSVRAFLYGGTFTSGIQLSRGGNIGGSCDVYVFSDLSTAVSQGSGSVAGNVNVYLSSSNTATTTALPKTALSADDLETKQQEAADILDNALSEKLSFKTTIAFADRDVTAAGAIQKGDANIDGMLTLQDVLLALKGTQAAYQDSLDVNSDGKISIADALQLLRHVLNSLPADALYALYGDVTLQESTVNGGFAFKDAGTANYTVASDVTLAEDGIVGLFFGCNNSDPKVTSGYYFEVNTARGVLAAYRITDGNFRTVGEKKLDLLSDTAKIYVTYADGAAQLYFDDNALESETYFDFDFLFPAEGNFVGIYTENATASLPICTPASKTESATYQNELISNFNDPEIFYEEGTYYIFGGGSAGVRLYTTTDFQSFTYEGTVLEKGDAFGDREFVAANIIKQGDRYYMFYLAYNATLGESREAYAVSQTVYGPYTNDTMAELAPDTDIIGGQPFVDDDGTVYLVYTRTTGGNQTYGAKVILNDGTATLDLSTEKLLLTVTDEWEYARACVVECGFIVKHEGLYYLIYAGGNYNSTYGVGYAVSESPLGPYTKYEHNPILQSNDQSFGVGAASIFPSPDGTEHLFVYLRNYSYAAVRPLQTCMDRIRFVADPKGGPDILEIAGPTVTPQPLPSGLGLPSAIDYQTLRFHW